MQPFTDEQLRRARDYVTEEPGFTAPFMAWELGWPLKVCQALTAELLNANVVELVEPASRPYAAVYRFRVPRHRVDGAGDVRVYQGDYSEPRADLAADRGVIVPHTRVRGRSGRPGENKQRQERGVRIKRGRNGS